MVMTHNAYLDDVLELLWPGGSETPSGSPVVRLVALPNARSPRVVLPGRPWRVSSGALRHYRTSATGVRRVAARLGSLGLRLGAGELLPGRLSRPSPGGIDTHLSEMLGRRVHVSIYVGPQRAVQKPVLQLLDASGMPVAYAKVAVNATTTALIRHEAEALALLQGAGLTTVRVPTALHHGEWRSHELLVQEALLPTGPTEVAPDHLVEAAREVAAIGRRTEPDLGRSGYVTELLGRLSAVPAQPASASLSSALHSLLESPAPSAAFGSWHGDWAPWNMARSGDQVLVWDWEGFRTGVPLGFDACHYDVAAQVTLRGVAPVMAFRALFDRRDDVLGPMGVAVEARAWTALLYVVELATSYLENGEADVAGTALSRLGDWLDDTLEAGRSAVEHGVAS